jgi:hypothetical protein
MFLFATHGTGEISYLKDLESAPAMTQSELVVISRITAVELKANMGRSFKAALALRREIQVALTKYSKTHKQWDAVKDGAVRVCRQIESWCRDAYYKKRMVSILKEKPSLALQGKNAAKTIVKSEFETMIVRESY